MFNITGKANKTVDELRNYNIPMYAKSEVTDAFRINQALQFRKYKRISRNPSTIGDIQFSEGILEDSVAIAVSPTDSTLIIDPAYYHAVLTPFIDIDRKIEKKLLNGQITPAEYCAQFTKTALVGLFLRRIFSAAINAFNFDVNAIRNTMLTPQSNALKRNGSNLHFILDKLKNDANSFDLISSSLTGIVSEVDNLVIESQRRGTDTIPEIIFKENGKFDVARYDISDGTLILLAILTALYSGAWEYLIVFEEPERHLHLNAISYLMELFRAYAKNGDKQLVITTQSSEILRNIIPETDAVVFMFRDYDGNTKAVSSCDIKEIETIMKNYDYNMDDIIRNNVLGYLGDHE